MQGKDLSYANREIAKYKDKLSKGQKSVTIGRYNKEKITVENVNEAEILRQFLLQQADFMVRCEAGCIGIYLNDSAELVKLLEKLTVSDVSRWKPDPKVKDLIMPDTVVTNKPSIYKYKITIDAWLARNKFPAVFEWIASNRDKIKITNHSLKNATSSIFVYVRDEKILMLLEMCAGTSIKKKDRIICKADIDK